MATKQKIRVTDMKYRDFKKLLEEYGYREERRINGSHVKFSNGTNSVVVGGACGGGGCINYPIVQKILKKCNII